MIVIIIPHNDTFSIDGRKPPFSVILWSQEGRNLANVAKKHINSEHSRNKCTHQVWSGLREYFSWWRSETTIFSHFVAKIRATSPKSESFLNTDLTSVHHKFELDCVNTFSDNGRKPPLWTISVIWGALEGQN